MHRELKWKWVQALRSGKYEQGTAQLRVLDDDLAHVIGYCCLGVFCDIINPGGWYEGEHGEGPIYHELGDENELSETTRDKYGIATDQMGALARLNDHGAPFEAIADILEYSPLFRTEGEGIA